MPDTAQVPRRGMEILIGIAIFIFLVLLLEGLYSAYRVLHDPEKKHVRERLQRISSAGYKDFEVDIRRKKLMSKIPWLNRILLASRWAEKLHRLQEQADSKQPLGVFLLLSIVLAFIGLFVGSRFTSSSVIGVLLAVLFGMSPFLYLYFKKKQRMKRFEQQLPEALDLIARSLKAGHALSGGMKMVSEEMAEPVGGEFGKTLNEINFGVDFPEALKNLSERVDCPDLNFFVISIILQRETGGNLVEILENIAYLIRERFKLHGRIRVLAAQGKLSASILVVLPFAVAFGILMLNPKFIETLTGDPIGRMLIIFALISLMFGIFAMRRIIDIKV
jgi:tight adherence protein B